MGSMELRKYKDDYEMISTIDENGRERKKAIYRGVYFEVNLDQDSLIRFRSAAFGLILLITLFHVAGGFVDNQGMYQMYIALPYVLAFFPLMYTIMGIFSLPKEKRSYRRDEIGVSFERIKKSTNALLLFLGIGLLGEIGYVIFGSSPEFLIPELLYLTSDAVCAALTYFFVRIQKRITINEIPELSKEALVE